MPDVRREGGRQAAAPSRCARCGAPFHCGIDDPGGCWCAKLPPLPREAYATGAGCLCERCLREAGLTPSPHSAFLKVPGASSAA